MDGPDRKHAWLLLAAVLPGLFMNVTGFWIACACDVVLALGSLGLSRLLAPPQRPATAVRAGTDVAPADG